MSEHETKQLVQKLAADLGGDVGAMNTAFRDVARNVRTVLRRHYRSIDQPSQLKRPVCRFLGEEKFKKALGKLRPEIGLLTLARVYDEAHIALCKGLRAARRSNSEGSFQRPCIDLQTLAAELNCRPQVANDRIILQRINDSDILLFRALWKRVPKLVFDLPEMKSLASLPGEVGESQQYAGIGGGGGSDIISASLIGQLLELHEKKMDFLVSTRTWATGSQGKNGSKVGVKRQLYNADAIKNGNGFIPGIYQINENTTAEGRDLEAIPLSKHKQIFMVLDQSESKNDIQECERIDLKSQFKAVLDNLPQDVKGLVIANPSALTVMTVDTGGDVFGDNGEGNTTPDQDYRVQRAMHDLKSNHTLVTAVVAPGVDAPDDAPEIAKKAGGWVYRPTPEEQKMLLAVLKEYRMDGSDPNRFGKTTLALQARLKGIIGWTSLDLPEYVIDTWDNPWSSFVFIQPCMSDIIFMPTEQLLPEIEPKVRAARNGSLHLNV